MKGSRGFMLVQDMVIFLMCSLLLLSAGSAFKMALVRYQQSYRLTEGYNKIEAYLIGIPNDCMSTVNSTLPLGRLVELQLWEDSSHEKMLCNMLMVEK